MSIKCVVTGKKNSFGKSLSIRGISKKKKGIGLKTTSITKRKFKVNSLKKRIWSESKKKFFKIRISAKGMKTIDTLDIANFV